MKIKTGSFFVCAVLIFTLCRMILAGDNEYTGKFDGELVADADSSQRVVFRYISPDRLKGQKAFAAEAHVTSARLYDPMTNGLSINAVLVEEGNLLPVMFIDLNKDNNFSDEEKFTLKKSPRYKDIYEIKINIPIKAGSYTSYPTIVQFLRRYRIDRMTEADRLVEQSDEAFARGTVDVKGKKVLVQYLYDLVNKQVDPLMGRLGIDSNGDGDIDMDSLSPESAKGRGEATVFRLDNIYVSTKKADIDKNNIVLREHSAKDYKRIELQVGSTIPDFDFTDFNGKKRKFGEFRGKYVLLDIWGLWCPACMDELPHLKEAYTQFKERNFEIIGLNTDERTPDTLRKSFELYGVKWTQATLDSVRTLIAERMMISSFPTTMLISPEGKILSLSRSERDEPELRGEDLLETLDGILPQQP